MTDVPLWHSKSSHPQALHMNRCAGINDEPSIIALSYWTVLMSEQNRWRFLHCKPKAFVTLRNVNEDLFQTYSHNRSPDSSHSNAAFVRSNDFGCKFGYCFLSTCTFRCRRICWTKEFNSITQQVVKKLNFVDNEIDSKTFQFIGLWNR